jgi:hypothetical protein
MTQNPGIIDLSVNFECDDQTIAFIREFLCISKIGLVSKGVNISNRDSVVLKIKKSDIHKTKETYGYTYLVYENLDDRIDQKGAGYDVLEVDSPIHYRSMFQKLAGKNMGFEILISNLKYRNSYEVGKWFSDVKYIHYSCKKYGHQLILSSGASNIYDLISAKLFNSFLVKLDILPREYWFSLNKWLEDKNRGIVYDFN